MEKMMMIYADDYDNDDAGVSLIERRYTGTTPGKEMVSCRLVGDIFLS